MESKVVFDGTINLGHILNTLVMLAGGLYFVWELKSKLVLLIQETNMRHENNKQEFSNLKNDNIAVNNQLAKLAETTIELAKQEIRMNNIDNRILELSNRIHSAVTNGKRKITRS